MKCIGKPNADGGHPLAGLPGEEDSRAAAGHPTEDLDTCVPLAARSTILLKPQVKMPSTTRSANGEKEKGK
eukprot:12900480-Prorocentrum_lima.AAC.1